MTAVPVPHSTEPEPEWLPEPGDTVAGKYEVERVLGRGGMGVVIAARHKQLGHRVAVKCLLPAFCTDQASVARFTREAQAAVALRGEHVARVQDVGTLETGAPYMIMEFLSGIDLGAMVEQAGPLGVGDAVDYLLQACEAIAEAHTLGIVHRDLKPSNLFVSQGPDGSSVVKVLDFGIAKALETAGAGDAKLTATGMALGTPVYMSPEQIRDAKTVDRRTDIWALGAVLHELLAGTPPFAADTLPALCAMIVADPPAPLAELRRDVPPGLAAVVERCLRKPLDERFADVNAFAQALAPFARPASQVHVERIARIAARGATSERGTGAQRPEGWAEEHAVAATMASSPNQDELRAALPAKQTAAAWQTSQPDRGAPLAPSRHTAKLTWALVAATGVAAIVAVVVWLRPSGDGPPSGEPSVTTATEVVAADPSAAPDPSAPMAQPSMAGKASSEPREAREDAGTPAGAAASTRPSASAAATSRPPSGPTALPSAPSGGSPTKPRNPSNSHDPSILDRR
jgi:serine/threonine-protein kinase